MRHSCGFIAGVAVSVATNLATALNRHEIVTPKGLVILLFLISGALLYTAASRAESSERTDLSFSEPRGTHWTDFGVHWWVAFGGLVFLSALLVHISSLST